MVEFKIEQDAQPDMGSLGLQEINPIHVIKGEHTNSVDALDANPKVQGQFVTGSHDHTIKVWDASKAKCVSTLKGHEHGVWSICYTPDGKKVLSASPDMMVKLWDVGSGKVSQTFKAHTKRCFQAVMSPDGNYMASAGADRMIYLWDIRKPSKPVVQNKDSDTCVMTLDFCNDQRYIVSGTLDGVLNVLDTETNKMMVDFNTLDDRSSALSNVIYSVKSIKAHPYKDTTKNTFLIGCENKMVSVCDFDPDTKHDFHRLQTHGKFVGHSMSIRRVNMSADGSRMLSCCQDQSMRMWDAESMTGICVFAGHTDFVTGGAWISDTVVVSSSWDQRVMIWDTKNPAGAGPANPMTRPPE